MTGGDIAGLIAAGVFAVLVALLAVPIVKLGRVFDELRLWVRDLNTETEPLINEMVRTVATTNSQLDKVDGITDNVSDASANVSAMTSLVASTVGQPIIKVAAFSSGVRRAFSPQAVRERREQERKMRAAPSSPPDRTIIPDPPSSAAEPVVSSAETASSSPSDTARRPWWEGTEFDTPPRSDAPAAGISVDSAPRDPMDLDIDPAIAPEPVVIDAHPGAATAHTGRVPGVPSGRGRHVASSVGHHGADSRYPEDAR